MICSAVNNGICSNETQAESMLSCMLCCRLNAAPC